MPSTAHDTPDMTQNQSQINLLELPSEILTQILTIILEPDVLSETTVRWMIIRAYYQTRFLPVTPLPKTTASLLMVCHKVTNSVLPIIYGLPYWRCDCHLERLWLQVGPSNISKIKRMYVSVDDIKSIAEAVEIETIRARDSLPETALNMRFISLEELGCDAYEWEVLFDLYARNGPEVHPKSSVTPQTRRSALRLCEDAEKIVRLHGKLGVLVQRRLNASKAGVAPMGESDAIDISKGRIQWRFLKSEHNKRDNEEVIDLPQLIALFKEAVAFDSAAMLTSRQRTYTFQGRWVSGPATVGAT